MPQTLLVVDDNKYHCEFISAAAELFGWHCTATSTPAAFLEQLALDPSVILLDLLMPGMDGFQLLTLLGQRHCRAGIVLMSGVGERVLENADQQARALGLFVLGHLRKPFRLADLEAMLMPSPHGPELRTAPVIADRGVALNLDFVQCNESALGNGPQPLP
jgi:CheY-like chemotaxis protein